MEIMTMFGIMREECITAALVLHAEAPRAVADEVLTDGVDPATLFATSALHRSCKRHSEPHTLVVGACQSFFSICALCA